MRVPTVAKVAVMGAGAGGCACAAVLARKGFEVRLYNRSAERVGAILERHGLEILEAEGPVFVPIPVVTTNAEEAVQGADLVYITTTANGQRPMAQLLAPILSNAQIVVICSGSAGSLEFARIWAGLGMDKDILLGETATMPQAARMRGPALITIKLPSRQRTAAFPGRRTEELCRALAPLFETIPVKNVLDTGLNNPNFLIHPLPMVLNYPEIERTDGVFSLMNEGMAPGVLRCMDALDRERMTLQRTLGLPEMSLDDLYTEFGSGPEVYRRPGEPMGFKDRIHWRYVEEDVPFGSMFMASLGDLIGVETPVMDATNLLAGILMQVDYWPEARTPERLGLAGMDVGQIRSYLERGVSR